VTATAVCSITSARLLRSVRGTGQTAGRVRDILGQLLIEFPVTCPVGNALVHQATALAVISERLQTRHTNGELIDLNVVSIFSRALLVILSNLRMLHGHRGPPLPGTAHGRLASFHEALDLDDDGCGDMKFRSDVSLSGGPSHLAPHLSGVSFFPLAGWTVGMCAWRAARCKDGIHLCAAPASYWAEFC
jgi:hypothetical protein